MSREVGMRAHVNDDTREVNFEEVRKFDQKYHGQFTGLELDSYGLRAARKEELDFAEKRTRSVRANTRA